MTDQREEGYNAVSNTTAPESDTSESLADSLSTTSSRDATSTNEPISAFGTSPATSGPHSSANPTGRTSYMPSSQPRTGGRLFAEHAMSDLMAGESSDEDGSEYNVNTGPSAGLFNQKDPRKDLGQHLPRYAPQITTAASLTELFPDVMENLPDAKIQEWIEKCKKSGEVAYRREERTETEPPREEVEEADNGE